MHQLRHHRWHQATAVLHDEAVCVRQVTMLELELELEPGLVLVLVLVLVLALVLVHEAPYKTRTTVSVDHWIRCWHQGLSNESSPQVVTMDASQDPAARYARCCGQCFVLRGSWLTLAWCACSTF